MPDPVQPDQRRTARGASERASDRAAIDRLTADLLPALIGKLTATGLGEIEVREGAWKVRLRRPPDATGPVRDRKGPDRAGRSGAGHGSHAVAGLTPVGPGRDGRDGQDGRDGSDPRRTVATSPAVGIFQPRPDARPGTTVRAGDRLGVVDMLGVPQDVLAPLDGVVGSSLVEPGDAVEYGQELLVIELAVVSSKDD